MVRFLDPRSQNVWFTVYSSQVTVPLAPFFELDVYIQQIIKRNDYFSTLALTMITKFVVCY